MKKFYITYTCDTGNEIVERKVPIWHWGEKEAKQEWLDKSPSSCTFEKIELAL